MNYKIKKSATYFFRISLNIIMIGLLLGHDSMQAGGLPEINYISMDNRLNISKEELDKQSLLTKLLYSIIWKNGDLGKEKHIIEGVLNFNKIDEKGLVFYHFQCLLY